MEGGNKINFIGGMQLGRIDNRKLRCGGGGEKVFRKGMWGTKAGIEEHLMEAWYSGDF